jgi:hypothetical protein
MRNNQRSSARLIGTSVALAALSAMALVAPAGAQNPQVQLAFGYDCGDQFQVRNDGAQPVDVEYGVVGGTRSSARINARESVAITSQSGDALELWVNGRRVATEAKGNRSCSSDNVVVRPLNSGNTSGTAMSNSAPGNANCGSYYGGGDNVNYAVQPVNTVYVSAPATSYYPYYDPYYYGYGYGGYGGYGYGYYGYGSPILSIRVPFGSSRYGYGYGRSYPRGPSRGGYFGRGGHVGGGGGGHVGGGGGRTAVRR